MRTVRHRVTHGLVAASLLLAIPGATASPVAALEGHLADEQLGGTHLSVIPAIPYETALLAIAGPDGYGLSKTFEAGTPIAVDLLADVAAPTSNEGLLANRGHVGWTPSSGKLPDGGYSYEIYFTGTPAGLVVHDGEFFVREGLLEAAKTKAAHEERAMARADDGGGIQDINDPGTIRAGIGLVAGSTTHNPAVGEVHIVFGAPEPKSVEAFAATLRLRAVDGVNQLNLHTNDFVGINTLTPQRDLHINSSSFVQARLQAAGTTHFFDLNVGPVGLWFMDRDNISVARFNHGAPSGSLTVDPGGVGIHRVNPQHHLDVLGDGATAGRFQQGTLIVERTDGGVANIRFQSTGGPASQSWLFQNNPGNLVFAIRDETAGLSPFRIFGGSPENNFVVRNARWGLNVANPAHPIDTNTGARLTAGGVWQNASSRTLKDGIETLSVTEALETLLGLEPVKYNYKADPEGHHVGFIAEDVPALVASADRLGLSPMDIVAVLTRVVQEQHGLVQEQQAEIERLVAAQDELGSLRARLEALERLLEAGSTHEGSTELP